MRLVACLLTLSIFAAGAAQTPAQNAQGEDMQGLRIQPTKGTPTPTPFPLEVATGRVESLEFRAPDAMAAADRTLAESAQGEIARRAGLQGIRLDRESGAAAWGYEQAVCPVFSDHLVLEYSRSNGAGDVTLFSAVVPRSGEGHVRVIPVRRRGYSLWTPASSNALTLNDFNHMVKEEPAGLSADWLRLGLCYAALAGGHVRAALVATVTDESYPLFAPAGLSVSRKGGAAVHFVNAAEPAGHSEWVLDFAQSGRLLKVKRVGPKALVERPTRGGAAEVAGVPTKEQPAKEQPGTGKTAN